MQTVVQGRAQDLRAGEGHAEKGSTGQSKDCRLCSQRRQQETRRLQGEVVPRADEHLGRLSRGLRARSILVPMGMGLCPVAPMEARGLPHAPTKIVQPSLSRTWLAFGHGAWMDHPLK